MSHVNKIKMVLRIRPSSLVFNVIDDKGDVLGNPIRLNRRQIHTMERRLWETVGHYSLCFG